MKKIFAICLFSAFVLTVCGRNAVSFAYDAAGNRVKREIVMSRSMPADDSDNHEEESDVTSFS